MSRHYVDNAMNRSLGRVGMTHGSMPVSSSSGSGGGGYSSPSNRTYVDNSSNRSLGRVGMAHGSMPVSRSSGSGGGGYSSPSTRTYVDNSSNRSLGRVGMAHGSMPVSRSIGSGGGGYSSSSTRTYVDNSSNRSLGRVGMAHGSMPVSRSIGSGGGGYSSSSTRTYVDNSSNRSLGRVGMPHGSMPVSRSSGSGAEGYSSSSTRTYVDNSSNRSLGRVGMPHGSMVVSRNDSGSHGSSSNETKTYVDNSYNRGLGRVGMKHGSMVVSKGSNTPKSRGHQSLNNDSVFCSPSVAPKGKVYKDNPLNRRLDRVGLPHGTAVHSLVQQSPRQPAVSPKTYVDNAFNRSVGRVGKPLGSMQISMRSKTTYSASDIFKQLKQNSEYEPDFSMMSIDEEQQMQACDIAVSLLNRMEEVLKWQAESHTTDEPQTSEHVLKNFREIFKIDFDEIELKQKIGSGGFSDVYFAKWKGTIVAAKVLRVQRVSKRRLKQFTDEISVLCKLDHPNIVKFIGASVVTPNLCILIEYMQMSLFDALHMKDDVEFSEKEKITIIQHTTQGLQYLHDSHIAHCDMKSQNILLNYKPDDKIPVLVVKITDFGLSMMKNNTDTSSSVGGEYVRNIGTPRYSSPENLRGELLNVKSLMMSDIYSYSLVVFEVICEDEPFYNLNYQQLKKQVGEQHLIPDIPIDILINPSVLLLLKKCWDRDAIKRPTAKQFVDQALCIGHLYEQN